MQLIICTMIFLCLIVSSLSAETDISLKGMVTDGDGAAIAGASIVLVSDTMFKGVTNAKGEFRIENNPSISDPGILRTKGSAGYRIEVTGSHLRIVIPSDVVKGSVNIFSASGKQIFTITCGAMCYGLHEYKLPELAVGYYIIHFTADRFQVVKKMVSAGNRIYLSGNSFYVNNLRSKYDAAVESVDTLLVDKNGFKPEKYPVTSYKQADITVIMDRTKSPLINSVMGLPVIKEMPDPLIMKDGTKVTTMAQWKLRRREMIRILEDYEYGHMPPPPGNVKGTETTSMTRIISGSVKADYRKIHLSFGKDGKLGFDLGIFTPANLPAEHGFPVLISVDFSAGKSSLGAASAAVSRGYAVATIQYTQLGADNNNYKSTAFFPSYPEYDWRDFSAWAWGISRAVDYLITDTLIDKEKIMVTGTSRCGQAALLAGAFDERIALTAPVAGGMAFRFSGKEMGRGLGQGITEIVDQNTIWFGPLLEKFRNQTPRLPCDQHWLPALTAPRLFIMLNSFADEYGRAYAAVQTFLGARPVYAFLNATDKLGMNFREGGHGMTSEDWKALLDFADQNLLKKGGDRNFNKIPPSNKLP